MSGVHTPYWEDRAKRAEAEVRALEQKRVELNVTIGERDAEVEHLQRRLRVVETARGAAVRDIDLKDAEIERLKKRLENFESEAVEALIEVLHENGIQVDLAGLSLTTDDSD